MIKKISVLLIVSFMMIGSGCSTYNSIVPDWASIGASSTSDTTKTVEKNDDDWSWWNPFSWF